MLADYGFTNTDEFDVVVMDSLEAGFINPENLRRTAWELNKKIEYQRQDNAFGEAWRQYHDAFSVSADEVLDQMATAFRGAIQVITAVNLDGTIRLFKELGRAEQARELLNLYMAEREGPPGFFDLEGSPFGDRVTDPDLRAAFLKKLATFAKERTPREILLKIAESRGWNQEDIRQLASLTSENFRDIFKDADGP